MKIKKGFLPIESNISKILKPVLTKKKKADFAIINNLNKNWQKIIGEKCHQLCFPKKVKFEKSSNNNILTISVNSSAAAFYLEANSNQIIENIASYYGYKAIHKINIIQELREFQKIKNKSESSITKSQEEFIENSTANIKNKDLQEILQKLGKSIFK